MHNGIDAVGIDKQVQHLCLLSPESTVEKQVSYNWKVRKTKMFRA